MPEQRVHGVCIDIGGTGVLIRGDPGSGKSDLALRLIDGGARLVADDQVEIRRRDGAAVASPPDALSGYLEVRGIGIVAVDCIHEARLGLIVDLAGRETIDRMPEPRRETVAGVDLPVIRLDPFAASATAKLRLAVRALRRGLIRD
jgi:serine kinase of HPr protein (carbohydrate metabolism regulator)